MLAVVKSLQLILWLSILQVPTAGIRLALSISIRNVGLVKPWYADLNFCIHYRRYII